ncbi:hypothetical protein RUM43_008628 [Polyplax serrata]|uniref:Uncharacterized protein n=1 Tax=Polyplax serrata TaxID=468196 RepID=A0AAN8NTY2_POLSC
MKTRRERVQVSEAELPGTFEPIKSSIWANENVTGTRSPVQVLNLLQASCEYLTLVNDKIAYIATIGKIKSCIFE